MGGGRKEEESNVRVYIHHLNLLANWVRVFCLTTKTKTLPLERSTYSLTTSVSIRFFPEEGEDIFTCSSTTSLANHRQNFDNLFALVVRFSIIVEPSNELTALLLTTTR